MSEELLHIGEWTFHSRLIMGKGRHRSAADVVASLEASGAEVRTVAIRRPHFDTPHRGTLLDVAVPRVNAFQLCERLNAHPSTRSVPVVMLVEPNALDARLRGLEVGAEDFLHRPVNKLELLARVKTLVRVKRLNEQVESTENVIYGLAHLIEEKETGGQNGFGRLADLACALGRELDLGEEALETLRKGAVLHDIGKIGVRESVLLKQGELSPEEFDEIKLHPEVGARICAPLRCADQVLPLIRHPR